MVYIAPKDGEFPPEETPTAKLEGDDNIVSFEKFGIIIDSGVEYKWKVDCVEESKRRIGDVWHFTMK